ncbi:ATP-binding protein [Streptomyces glaucus]|uniref:ATP-binding protein n=1 Tax=Streptomyces glaucus TaxID=284029 RepID=A0ABN3JF73_9ACTN
MIPPAPLGTDAAAGRPGLGAATGAGPAGATAQRRFRFELAAHPGSPAQARRLTRARLSGWSVCEDTCDTAALVVSELVTNAIVHTASRHIVCELHDGDDLVRIAVRDEGCAPGRPQASARQRPEEEHGRGLLLVDALCRAWGAQEQGPGLLVWADLPRRADDSGGPAGPRDDLGWGAPAKPGTPGGPGDGQETRRPREDRTRRESHASPEDHAQREARTPREDRAHRKTRTPQEDRAQREEREPREDRTHREARAHHRAQPHRRMPARQETRAAWE